jgi:hypothetical protein
MAADILKTLRVWWRARRPLLFTRARDHPKPDKAKALCTLSAWVNKVEAKSPKLVALKVPRKTLALFHFNNAQKLRLVPAIQKNKTVENNTIQKTKIFQIISILGLTERNKYLIQVPPTCKKDGFLSMHVY